MLFNMSIYALRKAHRNRKTNDLYNIEMKVAVNYTMYTQTHKSTQR